MKRNNYFKTIILSIIAILTIFVLSSCINSSKEKSNDSLKPDGIIKEGIREVNLETGPKVFSINIFRGETIRLIFKKQDYRYSINIPDLKITREAIQDAELIVEFKAETIGVFEVFCDCPSGSGINAGKINIIEYKAESETFFKNLSAKEAKEIIEKKNPFILDVRTQAEYDSGFIPGAKLIPVQQLATRISEIEKYKEKDILVYCRTGNRSVVAVEILEDNGFKRIYHLSTGIVSWINAGFDIKK